LARAFDAPIAAHAARLISCPCGIILTLASRRRYNRPTRRGADFWNEEFDDPIPLPDGTELVTLHDAGLYIAALPERVHVLPDWQLAIKELHRAA
jgi:hypothetical protein